MVLLEQKPEMSYANNFIVRKSIISFLINQHVGTKGKDKGDGARQTVQAKLANKLTVGRTTSGNALMTELSTGFG